MRALVAWTLSLLLGACTVEVVELTASLADDADIVVIGSIPKSAIDRFATAKVERADPMRLALIHPEPATAIPMNCAPLTFSWQPARPKGEKPKPSDPKPADQLPGEQQPPLEPEPPPRPSAMAEKGERAADQRYVYELALSAGGRTMRIYTDQLSARAPDEGWRTLLTSAESMLTVQLRALRLSAPGSLLETTAQQLLVRGAWPAGQVYFRSGGATLERARIAESDADALNLAGCGGDFTVARSGGRLGISCAMDSMRQFALPDLKELEELSREERHGEFFGEFDRDGARIIRAYDAQLDILDARTGALHGQRPVAEGARVADASWSSDGSTIVLAYWPRELAAASSLHPGASIAIVRIDAQGELGEPSVLVQPSGKDETLRHPAFAPNGLFITYVRGKAAPDGIEESSLWLVSAAGGQPVELFAGRSKDDKRAPAPRPIWLESAGQAAWLLFTAARDYRDEKRPMHSLQLWASWVDTSIAAPDALAAPPFWLPFQDLEQSNERPQWAAEQSP